MAGVGPSLVFPSMFLLHPSSPAWEEQSPSPIQARNNCSSVQKVGCCFRSSQWCRSITEIPWIPIPNKHSFPCPSPSCGVIRGGCGKHVDINNQPGCIIHYCSCSLPGGAGRATSRWCDVRCVCFGFYLFPPL